MDKVVTEEKKIEGEVSTIIDEDRVVGFSDAVFAFAATLLVLKIDLPQVVRSQLETNFPAVFATLWPQYMANIISFLVIGYYWLNHHAIFSLLKRFNSTIVWINLVFLIFLSFIPFPVDLYGDYPTLSTVVVFYSASLAFTGYFLAGIWWYASHNHRLVSKELSDRTIQYYLTRLLIAPIVFTISIPLVYIHPALAQISWIFIVIGTLYLNSIFRKK